MSRRGGTWGTNFISASGPQSSISLNSLQAAEVAAQELQQRASHQSISGRSAFPPPSSSNLPPPPTAQNSFAPGGGGSGVSSGGGGGMSATGRAFSNLGKRRMQDDDDYFNDDDEAPEDDGLMYQPAPGSPGAEAHQNQKKEAVEDSDASDDPLDAYMMGIEEEVEKINAKDKSNTGKKKENKNIRDDIEQEDEMEAYLRFMAENPNVGVLADEEEIYEYDEDGNIIATEKKSIDPLPPVDHSTIDYPHFDKNFYVEHPDITTLSHSETNDLLRKLNIHVSGLNPPKPVCAFAHLSLDEPLMESIRKADYVKPMPIQAAAVPAALSGRDIVGIAMTGSGKTVAFLWPLVTHIMSQPPLQPGDGAIGVICVPTRELALQIYSEAKKVARVYNLTVVCAYGGGSMWEQQKACEAGCEILVCTPGRLIDLVKKKATNFLRTTFLVFDEADKMFNLGFEPQVRSIANHVRPDRQALLFSATFKSRIERLARDILTDPIRIVQGEVGEANEDITQVVEIFNKWEEKWDWLANNLVRMTSEGSVLIFVTRKAHSVDIAQKLKARDFLVLLIHGDMHQSERNSVMQKFKHQEAPILVATDVASRGLDIPSIHNVVNFEVARDIDTHTHRVGRTGRAGVKGTAYTLFLAGRDPPDFAAHLVRHLEMANQMVPPRLLELSYKCPWFADKRNSLGNTHARPGMGFQPREKRDSHHGGDSQSYFNPTGGPATVAASSEHQTDRLAQIKQAFASQYQRRFVSAGVEKCKYTHPERFGASSVNANETAAQSSQNNASMHPPASVPDPATKRKRSRWD